MNRALSRGVALLYDSPPLLLGLATLFWAGNTVAGQLAVGEVSPMLLTLLRWVLVASALWALYGREAAGYWPQVRPQIGLVAITAALGFSAFNGLYYAASIGTTAVNIGILQGAMPVLVLAGAYLFQGTRLGLLASLGVGVTLVGVVVLASQGAPQRLLAIGLNPGDALMLCACVCYASYTLLLKGRPPIPGLPFFTIMAPIAALAAAPMAAAEFALGYGQAPTAFGWVVAIWIAIFPSCLSQLFFLRGVDLIGPSKAGVYLNLVPVFTPVLAVAILSQPFELFHAAALALVLGGLWLAQRPQGDELKN